MSDKDDFQKHLYDVASKMYRYVHSDVWSGQKYYTTLNTAIIGVGFSFIATIIQLSPASKNIFLTAVPIFFIGCIVSAFAYYSIKEWRKNFLQVIWFKTVIEKGLEDELEKIREKAGGQKRKKLWRLTPVYSLPDGDHQDVLTCTDSWIKEHISNRFGVTWFFLRLQTIFAILNVIGIATAIYLWLC